MRADDHLCRGIVGSDLATNKIQSTHRRLLLSIETGQSAGQSRMKTPLLLLIEFFHEPQQKIYLTRFGRFKRLIMHKSPIDFAYGPGNLVTAKMKLPSRKPSNITVSIFGF